MSRFFNETRKNVPGPVNPVNPTIDVQDVVSALKERMAANSDPQASHNAVRPLTAILENSNEIATRLTSTRLERCRSIRLPRDQEKSFLMAQYNRSMQAAVEAYRTLRTRLSRQQEKKGTRSMVVSSAVQGEGKTLTTLNLGLCYANIQDWPVLLVDGDLRTRGLSTLVGAPQSPGLGEILEGTSTYEEAILRTSTNSLYVLPAGASTAPAPELFSKASWKDLLGWAAESFRLTIIDSPPILDLADFELIAAPCESVLLVARTRSSGKELLAKTWSRIDHSKVAGVVLNSGENARKANSYYYASPSIAPAVS